MKMELTGSLYVVSAPSGAGKTSLVKALVNKHDNLKVAVSHTTRPRRPHERDGLNYHFIDPETFETMRQDGGFVECAVVYQHQYGTSWSAIHTILGSGHDIILEIDWQGAMQISATIPDSRSIFILPPSLNDLRTRLQTRGEDGAEVIERRMAAAVDEIRQCKEFDYLIVNDDFDTALVDLESITAGTGDHLLSRYQSENLQPLVNSLLST